MSVEFHLSLQLIARPRSILQIDSASGSFFFLAKITAAAFNGFICEPMVQMLLPKSSVPNYHASFQWDILFFTAVE